MEGGDILRELLRDELVEFIKKEILEKSDPHVKSLNTLIGSRVIRGPDWKWENQDGGAGYVGTVVSFKNQEEAMVRWDNGICANYRCAGPFDLRIIDSAPAGIEHSLVMCDGCSTRPLFGIRWKCVNCENFDLCSRCYHQDQHDKCHQFRRIDVPEHNGVLVDLRLRCKKMPIRGLFIGAQVERGHDWRWGAQDGGAGKTGMITTVNSKETNERGSTVAVKWDTGGQNIYRVGHDGKVDLKSLQHAKGYSVYTSHLPHLSKPVTEGKEKEEKKKEEKQGETEGEAGGKAEGKGEAGAGFKAGDKVKIELDKETVELLQDGYGGWNEKMSEYLGPIGEVVNDTGRSVLVKFPDGKRLLFNPIVLSKVAVGDATDVEVNNNSSGQQNSGVIGFFKNIFGRSNVSEPLNPDDIVQVSTDQEKVKAAQKDHGGWTQFMALFLGKTGKVIRVIGDVVIVEFGQTVKWSYNKISLTKINLPKKGNYVRISNDKAKVERLQDNHGGWNDAMAGALGKIGKVAKIDKDFDVQVKLQGGQRWYFNPAVLTKLGDDAANISDASDDEDDAVFSRRMVNAVRHSLGIPITKSKEKFKIGDLVLISSDREMVKSAQEGHGGWIDFMVVVLGEVGNVVDITPVGDLKVKVGPMDFVFNPDCVSLLSSPSAEEGPVEPIIPENQEDQLFQAASDGDHGIVEVLLALNDIEVNKLTNGQTPLHVACQKGHAEVVRLLLAKGADVEKEDQDGDKPIHCAAVGGDGDVIDCLARGQADLNARNAHGQTPIHITVNKGNPKALKKLLELGCYPSFKDMEGYTPVHDAVLMGRDDMVGLLLKFGADVVMENKSGLNCLHLASFYGNPCVLQVILSKQDHSWYVDGKKCAGAAALHWAVINQRTEAVRFLCIMGKANKDVQNHLGQTPLHLAALKQNADIILFLVNEGASLKIQDRDGDTALHEAFRRHPNENHSLIGASSCGAELLVDFGMPGTSSAAIAYFLAANGSDLTLRNSIGNMALDLCTDPNLIKIITGSTTEARSSISPHKAHEASASASSIGHPTCDKCHANPKDTIFKPCGHVVVCSTCAIITAACPVCQEVVKSKVKIEECLGCTDISNVQCEPCGHICACANCAKVGKKCPECRVVIVQVVSIWTPTQRQLPSMAYQQNRLDLSIDEIQVLRGKVQELEEKNICCICIDREKRIAFRCGHRFCEECTLPLVECPICRGPTDDPIKVF